MSHVTLSCIISVWIFGSVVSGTSFGQESVNQLVSLDLFGELVDIVTPGYLHWNRESGDIVDPDDDRNDIDNNFGEHEGFMDSPEFSSKVTTYGSGNGVVTDGQIAALGRQGNQVCWFLCVGGTSMEVDGKELFRSDEKVTIALDDSRSGSILLGSATTDHAKSNVTITFGDAKPVTLKISSGTAVLD
jgi:hypothetical protein